MAQNALFNTACECKGCGSVFRTPFIFPMHNQSVMLISAVPSIQAMYKPLPSIRFFRNVCLALFGDRCLRNRDKIVSCLREFCDNEGEIYWTHYHKCCEPELRDLGMLDNVCADAFLANELDALRRELKLIIVLGETIHEKVKRLLPGNLKSMAVYLPFPTLENIAEFEDVRLSLKEHLRYFDKKSVGLTGTTYQCSASELEGNAVHLHFEFEAFEKMWSETEPDAGDSIEEIWHKNFTVPNMRRCNKLVHAYAFIETQVRVQILNYLTETGNYSILTNLSYANRTATMSDVVQELEKNWTDSALKDYVRWRAPEFFPRAEELMSKIRALKPYRHALVHDGGIRKKRITVDENRNGLPGIYSFAGTVVVSAEGEQTLIDLTREVTELLCSVQ